MRPTRVVMRAFGPFASEQVVDFRELGDNRFFLIHGPTGAGKTTVLDAMCYALYGTTTGAERSAEQMRSQFAPDTLPTEVVFDFAIGEECYRVRRRPAQERAKARGTGTTTVAAEAALWRRGPASADADDGTPLATKARDVDSEVVRIVGFDVDQFRQVVMLPQGRFRELLSASSKDREKIMQALFATGRYAGIESELKQRRAAISTGIEDARKLRDETLRRAGVASDDELAELVSAGALQAGDAVAACDAAREVAEAAGAALEAGRGALSRLAQVAAAASALQEAERALDAGRLVAADAEAALAAEQARAPELEAASERVRVLEQMQKAVGELQSARGSAAAAASALEARTEASEQAQHRLADLLSRQAQARAAAADAAAAATACAKTEATLDTAAAAVGSADALASLAARIAAATTHRDERVAASMKMAEAARAAASQRDSLLLRWRDGRAASLAATLESGAPCPVCGSTEHPAPAHTDVAPPSDEAVADAEDAARLATAAAATAARDASEAETVLAGLTAEEKVLRRSCKGAVEPAAARAAHEAAAAACKVATARLEAATDAAAAASGLDVAVADASTDVESARVAREEASAASKLAARDLDEAKKRVPESMREPGALEGALKSAIDEVAAVSRALETARSAAEAARASLAAAEATHLERSAALEAAKREAAGVSVPDLPALEAAAAQAAAVRDSAVAEVARIEAECAARAAAQARLDELDAQSGELLSRFETVAAISDAATGSNPARLSFQRYVLGVFLTDVLEAATRRLEIMTRGRYRLHMAAGPRDRRSASGLELEVFDEYTGDDRPVATLSGGEGFLASLALALGLAEVVESLAGGVHLDTVFVDEGFGSLDEEALETAIDALMELQGRSRLVGIISHVTELQAVVPARLEVSTGPSGSTARFIVP
jgi:DNA repair protein SbcC/Rad50